MKTCSRCREDLPASQFGRNSNASEGLAGWCRPCYKEYNAERYRAGLVKRSTSKRVYTTEQNRRKARQRRARKNNVYSSPTQQMEEVLAKFFFDRCLRCGSTEDLTLEHIVSIHHGGPDMFENYQRLCRSCNSSKQARYADYRPTFLRLTGWVNFLRPPTSPDAMFH